jgi:hypothetical protein
VREVEERNETFRDLKLYGSKGRWCGLGLNHCGSLVQAAKMAASQSIVVKRVRSIDEPLAMSGFEARLREQPDCIVTVRTQDSRVTLVSGQELHASRTHYGALKKHM